MHAPLTEHLIQRGSHAFWISDVATVGFRIASALGNFAHHLGGSIPIPVEQADPGAAAGKTPGNCPSDAAAAPGDDGESAIESK
jgi:hypothetical protein